MKITKNGIRIKSENRKILYKFTIIAFLSGLFLIGLFYLVQMKNIQTSAVLAIEHAEKEGRYVDGKLPEAYTIYADYANEGISTKTESKLIHYYLDNIDWIPDDEISKFEMYRSKIFFIPAENNGNAKENPLLIYTDVTFSEDLVKQTVEILIVALGFITVLLFLAGRHFGNVLDEKDDRLKQFFANASHELKTPLMAIQGNADGIRNGYVEIEAAYQIINKEVDRMTKLIGDILELSKLDSGVMSPSIEQANIREIIYDAMSIVEPIALQKNIKIEVNMPNSIMRRCDEGMLFSAISNILTNSIRYALTKIKIDLTQNRESKAKICISNDGVGLKKDEINHIFDRFYKGDKGQSGIGLSLSLGYIRLQGGNIVVRSEEDRSVFEITI
ncbi:HAMP domain-containing sensor histidine kinase [Tissierella praeacuta]|uniref:sensor histidine kinase n=1 Tax=Tissierella praeacuta TaxID=43131 RepID=UPI0033400E5A